MITDSDENCTFSVEFLLRRDHLKIRNEMKMTIRNTIITTNKFLDFLYKLGLRRLGKRLLIITRHA